MRDPRALALSRVTLDAQRQHVTLAVLMKAPSASFEQRLVRAASTACPEENHVTTDIKSLLQYISQLRNQLALLRYEDVVDQPHDMAQCVYKFIDLELPSDVTQRLVDAAKAASPSHVTTTQQQWRQLLSHRIVNSIQGMKACSTVLDFYGYGQVRSERHQRNVGDDKLLRRPSSMLQFMLRVTSP